MTEIQVLRHFVGLVIALVISYVLFYDRDIGIETLHL